MRKVCICSKKGFAGIEKIISFLKKGKEARKAGAIASFFGIVRGFEKGHRTEKLVYECHKPAALGKLEEIAARTRKGKGVIDVAIHHVVDELRPGEPALAVVVLAVHRKEAFSALEETVERIKKEVPIWKKEYRSDKVFWV